jgi:uncharacterized protein (UPF0332 family)
MKPDVRKHLRSADEFLHEMEHLIAGGFYRGVVGRAYYAMFHAATAALLAREMVKSSRQAIVSRFEDAFVKTGLLDKNLHQYFLRAFYARTEPDSSSFVSADHRQAQTALLKAREFIAACRKLCEG